MKKPFKVFSPFKLGAIIRAINSIWSPKAFFVNNEQGAWYDPSDLTTLFQDSAGTTPVTAVEQPVGLMLDKSKGLVLGPQLVTNGDFATDTWWSKGPGCTISGGVGVASSAANGSGWYRTSFLTVGKYYEVTFTVVTMDAGGIRNNLGTATGVTRTAPGTYTERIACGSTNIAYTLETVGTTTATVDNVSIKEVTGNHAFQSTSANRPVLSARVNLLTKTEDFSDAVWLKASSGSGVMPIVSADAGLSPLGTQTADLITINRSTTTGLSFLTQRLGDDGVRKSRVLHVKAYRAADVGKVLDTWTFDIAVANRFAITLTADWQKVTLPNVTLLAGGVRETISFGYLDDGSLSPNTGEIKFYAWGADLRVTNTGVNLPPYQRVNTSTDYDTTGFPLYLKANGTNTAMQTSSIDFTGTDKMTVWAGVRKLSDAAISLLLELSPDNNNNAGSFWVAAPEYTAASGNYTATSRGTQSVNINQAARTPKLAPDTSIVTSQMSISEDRVYLRLNGSLVATATGDQGTGKYGNYPLYLFARAGTSLYFNGNFYGLIVRGAQSSAAEIANAETWMNKKTLAYAA